jgi:hypothetical protein
MNEVLIIISLLFLKHFIVDFPLQNSFQYLNKGTYGHLGGVLHSLNHAAFTLMIFSYFAGTYFGLFVASIDFLVHYHVDWAKVKLNKKMGWGPTTHEQFWWLLGLDQLLHALTYIGLVWLML